MRYEVEQKYRVVGNTKIARQIEDLGILPQAKVTQSDAYYAHPNRDFAKTDEALRIRRVDDRNCITYKGPKIDAKSKTRQEIELSIEKGALGARLGDELWQALGFRQVGEVVKTRQVYYLTRGKYEIEIAIDCVEHLGDFVELETLTENSSELESAREAITELAEELGLRTIERRSYLELLLEK
ncbi:MAG: class IV adenylate cyclase [Pirellulales bacterium]|nr:class IV adenylate cyclase [Pirellulales bacterium]